MERCKRIFAIDASIGKTRQVGWLRRYARLFVVGLVLFITQIGLCDSQSFGYTYLTSDDEAGPVYEWIEISDTGTTSSINFSATPFITREIIPIGFPFAYDGDSYTSVVVFIKPSMFFSPFPYGGINDCIPTIGYPDNFVSLYAFYGEFFPVNNSQGEYVYYQILGEEPHRSLIVEWIGGSMTWPNPPKQVLQAILFEGTNEILFQYKNVDEAQHPFGGGPIIGLENIDGTDGLGYRCWSDAGPLVHNEMAILWIPLEGVFISPPMQRDYGYRGEEVRYRIRIKNQTGTVTSFMLEVTGNRWDTVIYEDGTGIELTDTDIMPGNTAKYFEVGVRIPHDARIGFTDVVKIITTDTLDASTTNSTTIETTAVSPWERMAPMPTARGRLVAETVGREIYAVGGEVESPPYVTGNCEVYNPQINTWRTTSLKPIAVTNLSSARRFEEIFCMGGMDKSGTKQEVEVYSVLTEMWSLGAELPTTYTAVGRGACLGEDIYYLGGGNPDSSYNSKQAFVLNANGIWYQVGALNEERAFHVSLVASGGLYVAGGMKTGEITGGIYNSVEKYDASNDRWFFVDSMNEMREAPIGEGFAGLTYVACGQKEKDGRGVDLKSHERYSGATQAQPPWMFLPDLHDPPRDSAASAIAEVEGKYYIFVIGGYANGIGFLNLNDRYLIWDGNVQDYGFAGDSEGWVADGAPLVFDMPEAAVGAEALELTAVNNTNCFGFWASATGAFDLEDEYIYRVRFVVSSDEVYKESIPRFRFRVGDGGFRFWSVSTHQSSADAHTLPDTVGTTYTLYFAPTDAVLAAPMVCAFDLLNFDPMDSANATLALKDVDIDFVPIEQTLNRAEKKQFTFDTSPEGWQFSGTIEPFDLPISSWQSSSIQMTALNNTNTFGYWFIELSDIQIKPYRLYLAEFTVSSDQSQARLVPSLRLRMSNHLFEQTSELVIPSGEDALLPLSDAPRTYRLYFSPLQSVYPREYWEELQGGTPPHLVLAFDLLGFDPDSATSATLSLHSVSLYTIDLNNL